MKLHFIFQALFLQFQGILSAYVIQANNNVYGDSRITVPMKKDYMNVVQFRGGENPYIVVGRINFEGLKEKHDLMGKLDLSINNLLHVGKMLN